MWPIVVVWVVAIAVGALLWVRFTRPAGAPTVPLPGRSPGAPRRVFPLWLLLVELILLAAALWLTFAWGAAPAP